jgi:hypothetical protein
MEITRSSIKQKVREEFKEILVVTGYLWIIFALLLWHKSVILKEEHVDFAVHGLALINAVALGKFLLVLRSSRLGELAGNRPVIHPTILKAALFSAVLACCKILEDVLVGHFRGRSLEESLSEFGGGTWQGILTLTLIGFVMLIPLIGYGELQKVLGKEKLTEIVFGSHGAPKSRKGAA